MQQPKAVDHTFRRKWDKAEFAAKADELGITSVTSAALVAADDAAPQRRAVTYEQDRGTATARTTSLALDANVGVRSEVADARTAGFFCAACNRAEKDSSTWLDHLNSVQHQKAVGASLRAERATVDDVHERLRQLKRKQLHALADATPATAQLDSAEFEARLDKLRQSDEARRAEKKAKRRAQKKAAKLAARNGRDDNSENNDDDNSDLSNHDETSAALEERHAPENDTTKTEQSPRAQAEEAAEEVEEDEETAMARMMGLPVGFSSTKRK